MVAMALPGSVLWLGAASAAPRAVRARATQNLAADTKASVIRPDAPTLNGAPAQHATTAMLEQHLALRAKAAANEVAEGAAHRSASAGGAGVTGQPTVPGAASRALAIDVMRRTPWRRA